MNYLRGIFSLFRLASVSFGHDGAATHASAIAYHTMLSLMPLILLFIGAANLVYVNDAIDERIIAQVEATIGRDAAALVEEILISNQINNRGTLITAAITIGALLFFASGMFHQLKVALNAVWDVEPQPAANLKRGILSFVIDRTFAFFMVLVISFCLLVIIFVNALVVISENMVVALFPSFVVYLPYAHFVLPLLFLVFPFAFMYKLLPDARIAWRDVWLGSIVTSLLFLIGGALIRLYIENVLIASFYGAAGTFIVILLWIYYMAMVVLFGAEFTHAHAETYGSRILPNDRIGYISQQGKRLRHRWSEVPPQTSEATVAPAEPASMESASVGPIGESVGQGAPDATE